MKRRELISKLGWASLASLPQAAGRRPQAHSRVPVSTAWLCCARAGAEVQLGTWETIFPSLTIALRLALLTILPPTNARIE